MESLDVTPKRWTRAEYEHLGELGVFQNGPRVELVEGQIVEMSPQNTPHSKAITRLNDLFIRLFGKAHYVRVQLPFNSGVDSQPEPDFCILRRELVDDSDQQPDQADLIVEVSDTSLAYDRQKSRVYARANVAEYWIINLKQKRLEVYREPRSHGYSLTRLLLCEEEIQPLGWPEVKIAVADLF